jgi:hypothetical protein
MKNIKNIDQLFQEKFKDFKVEPKKEIWSNIELALREKKNKKRIVPFWFKLAGIAAGLVIAFFVFDNNYEIQKKNNSIVNENSKLDDSAEKNNEKIGLKGTIENDVKNQIYNKDKTITNNENQVTKEENSTKPLRKVGSQQGLNSANESISKDKQLVNQKTNASYKSSNFGTKNTQDNAVVSVEKSKKSNLKTKIKSGLNLKSTTVEKLKIAENNKSSIAIAKTDFLTDSSANENNPIKDATKNITSIIDAKKTDSIVVALKTQNPLEKLMQRKELEKKKINSKANKWQITSNVAPVFFNSNSKDSPIDPALNQNSKSFETNLSLGIGMEYAISKKLTIRSGVNRFTMAYSTNDIFFRAGLGNPVMKNMSSADAGAGLEIVRRPADIDFASANEISPQNISEGIIMQKMGYFEVPLEISYALVNKKFGIDVIGGFSTLFLTENEITMQSGAMTTTLGKASNLRDLHLSSNIGIGFRYRFWKSFQARLEPTLKYQINTFTDNSFGFKPYFIGVYSGISFGF